MGGKKEEREANMHPWSMVMGRALFFVVPRSTSFVALRHTALLYNLYIMPRRAHPYGTSKRVRLRVSSPDSTP